ncbi:unnamed protein product [Rotaria socialis]
MKKERVRERERVQRIHFLHIQRSLPLENKMNSKYLGLLLIFGLLFTLAQCGRLTQRNDDDDSSDNDETVVRSINDDDSDSDEAVVRSIEDADETDDESLREEKRAIHEFLQGEEEASEFLDQSRRLFTSDTKSHMKDAKKKYEENCERLLHPRYCPDLATWPAWNQAWSAATGKK